MIPPLSMGILTELGGGIAVVAAVTMGMQSSMGTRAIEQTFDFSSLAVLRARELILGPPPEAVNLDEGEVRRRQALAAALAPEQRGTRVVSDFIHDPSLIETLANQTLWEECTHSTYRWWDGRTEPKDVWQGLVERIWAGRPVADGSVGYEYWCNILTRESGLGWHYDKDEKIFAENGTVKSPRVGAVYYGYPHSFRGGFLELQGERDGSEGELERIAPEYNRLVILNVSFAHRVSEITDNGKRFTFATNVWHERPSQADALG